MSVSTVSPLSQRLSHYISAYYADKQEQHLTPLLTEVGRYLDRICYLRLHINCGSARKDLVQNTLIRVLESLRQERFQLRLREDGTPASVLSWLDTVLKNQFIDDCLASKQNSARPGKLENQWEALLLTQPGPDLSEEDEAATILLASVFDRIERLPKRQQEAFRAFYLDGMPQLEAAGHMGLTVGCFKSTLHVALQAMKCWAASQQVPDRALYEAFARLPTHIYFGDGAGHQRAQAGYYSNLNAQKRAATRKLKLQANA